MYKKSAMLIKHKYSFDSHFQLKSVATVVKMLSAHAGMALQISSKHFKKALSGNNLLFSHGKELIILLSRKQSWIDFSSQDNCI